MTKPNDKEIEQSDMQLWRLSTVLKYIPMGRSAWLAGVKDGKYPAPIRLSPRVSVWKSKDIRAFIESL